MWAFPVSSGWGSEVSSRVCEGLTVFFRNESVCSQEMFSLQHDWLWGENLLIAQCLVMSFNCKLFSRYCVCCYHPSVTQHLHEEWSVLVSGALSVHAFPGNRTRDLGVASTWIWKKYWWMWGCVSIWCRQLCELNLMVIVIWDDLQSRDRCHIEIQHS